MPEEHWSWQLDEWLPSEPGAGGRVIDRVRDQLHRLEYSERDVFDVHMALEEGVVNAIRHGNNQDPNKRVHVLCQLSPHKLRIEIEDEGEGFDPEHVPDPTLPENLEKPCGRGIMLMRSFMNKVEYNERGNRVIMEKTRSKNGQTLGGLNVG
jgi:serine/threonine-protein kinase RsbW